MTPRWQPQGSSNDTALQRVVGTGLLAGHPTTHTPTRMSLAMSPVVVSQAGGLPHTFQKLLFC